MFFYVFYSSSWTQTLWFACSCLDKLMLIPVLVTLVCIWGRWFTCFNCLHNSNIGLGFVQALFNWGLFDLCMLMTCQTLLAHASCHLLWSWTYFKITTTLKSMQILYILFFMLVFVIWYVQAVYCHRIHELDYAVCDFGLHLREILTCCRLWKTSTLAFLSDTV